MTAINTKYLKEIAFVGCDDEGTRTLANVFKV